MNDGVELITRSEKSRRMRRKKRRFENNNFDSREQGEIRCSVCYFAVI